MLEFLVYSSPNKAQEMQNLENLVTIYAIIIFAECNIWNTKTIQF